MPEHFYLLITEPEVGDPSVVTKVIKERFSKQVHAAEENARKAHSFPQNALCARVGPQPHSQARSSESLCQLGAARRSSSRRHLLLQPICVVAFEIHEFAVAGFQLGIFRDIA